MTPIPFSSCNYGLHFYFMFMMMTTLSWGQITNTKWSEAGRTKSCQVKSVHYRVSECVMLMLMISHCFPEWEWMKTWFFVWLLSQEKSEHLRLGMMRTLTNYSLDEQVWMDFLIIAREKRKNQRKKETFSNFPFPQIPNPSVHYNNIVLFVLENGKLITLTIFPVLSSVRSSQYNFNTESHIIFMYHP